MAGIYRFLVIASGVDYEGMPFYPRTNSDRVSFPGRKQSGHLERTQGTAQGVATLHTCCEQLVRLRWILAILLFVILLEF